jgi:hypothetical protein
VLRRSRVERASRSSRVTIITSPGPISSSNGMPGIGGDREQRLGRRAEQQIVDHRLVLVGDRGDLGRQGEDQVEVADRQEIGHAGSEPALRRRALALGTAQPSSACRTKLTRTQHPECRIRTGPVRFGRQPPFRRARRAPRHPAAGFNLQSSTASEAGRR